MNLRYQLIIGCLVAASSLSAETFRMSSTVTAVTIYDDRATVTRIAQTSLRPGVYALSFNNLPVNILDQSVRVSGEAVGAKILDVRVELTFLDTIPEERIQALQSRIQELQGRVNEFNDRLSVLATERDFISQIKAQSADNISKDLKVQRPTVEDWQKVLAFFDSNLSKNFSEQRKIVKERTETQAKIDALQRQVNQISPGSRRASKNILVDVEVTQEGTLKLSPQYVVKGSGWHPEYEVRVATESQEVELTYRGVIQQSTGEDWKNVDLTLSTARPDLGGVKPELNPWYVTIAGPLRPMLKSAINSAHSVNEAAVQGQSEARMEPVDQPVARVESEQSSALFHVVAKGTVLSDNVPQKVTIAIEKLHAEFSYTSVPKLSPYVYLKAAIRNTTDAPLLAGIASIFSNDDYVALSQLKTIAPNESFEAYLGIDPSIKIERKLVNKFTDYTGTFTKNVRVSYEFSYALENNRKSEQTVAVQENIPISQNEKILVDQIEPSEKELRRDDRGILTWTIQMKPSEKRSWKLKFNVEYPQGITVSGLE
jgi:uncharacterized protein (TIGR02231 family)